MPLRSIDEYDPIHSLLKHWASWCERQKDRSMGWRRSSSFTDMYVPRRPAYFESEDQLPTWDTKTMEFISEVIQKEPGEIRQLVVTYYQFCGCNARKTARTLNLLNYGRVLLPIRAFRQKLSQELSLRESRVTV